MKRVTLKATELVSPKLLSKDEMKTIIGGIDSRDDKGGEDCLVIGKACNSSVQCCSNNCALANKHDAEGGITGYVCRS